MSVTNWYRMFRVMPSIHVWYIPITQAFSYVACKGMGVTQYAISIHPMNCVMVTQETPNSGAAKVIPASVCVSKKTARSLGFPTLLQIQYPRSAIAGHMVNGDVVYVTRFNYNHQSIISLAGHYVEGVDYTIGAFGHSALKSTTMMMMVVL